MSNRDQTEYVQEYTVLGVALNGCYASTATRSSNGGTTKSSISGMLSKLAPYIGNLVEGGVVIDKRQVEIGKLTHLVCSGPMLNEELPPKTIDRRLSRSKEQCLDASTARSMDYISLDLYIDLWEAVGAKVGFRHGDYIDWNDGKRTLIPRFEDRWLVELECDQYE